MNKITKERFWWFIMYPESMPENWKEILEEDMIPIAISPIHDKDIDTEGKIKKAHYHVILKFNGPTTYNRALEITEKVKGTIPKRIINMKSAFDYLTHKNNLDKAQYDKDNITLLSGFDINDIGYTEEETEEMKRTIIDIIRTHGINEYVRIYDLLYDEKMFELAKVLSKNVIFFNAYLKSKKFVEIEEKKC